MNVLMKTVVLTGLAVVMTAGPHPASASNTGSTQGCTPGYWKNHTRNWLETPTLRIASTTPLKKIFRATGVTGNGDNTMLQALSFNGGNNVDGAERILLRAAVASWLNSAHEQLAYPLRREGSNGSVAWVNATLKSQDRASMLSYAHDLDRANNLGCPLS